MRFTLPSLAAGLLISSSALGQARVIITEIMYNPNSNEQNSKTEWVEIANVGDQSIELKDWRLDDEDKNEWAKFSCTLAPGGVAVLINAGGVDEDQFRQAWDEQGQDSESAGKLDYQVIAVRWGGIANDPGPENEILQLRNDSDQVVCEVKQIGEWPACNKPDGQSIWLTDLKASEFSDGKLWQKSEAGKDGARANKKTEVFDGQDTGSPGFVPGLSVANPAQPPKVAPKAAPASDDTIDY